MAAQIANAEHRTKRHKKDARTAKGDLIAELASDKIFPQRLNRIESHGPQYKTTPNNYLRRENDAGDDPYAAKSANGDRACAIQIYAQDKMSTPKDLYGISGLTKDRLGNISWKGVIVDRYNFKEESQEVIAATKLAQDCRRLDELGIEVSCENLHNLWDRMRWAIDVEDAPKWAIFVRTSSSSQEIRHLFLGTSARRTVEQLQKAVFDTLSGLEVANTFTRSVPVAQREHLDDVVKVIEREIQSAKNVWGAMTNMGGLKACAAKNVDQIMNGAWIDREALPSGKEARWATLSKDVEKAPVERQRQAA